MDQGKEFVQVLSGLRRFGDAIDGGLHLLGSLAPGDVVAVHGYLDDLARIIHDGIITIFQPASQPLILKPHGLAETG